VWAAASQVSYSFIENLESTVYLVFKNVPMAQLGEVERLLMRVLQDILSGLERQTIFFVAVFFIPREFLYSFMKDFFKFSYTDSLYFCLK
jgi:hypothetical protein